MAVESELQRRLRSEVEGNVLFDAFSRGRYSTDASIYQIEPVGVVIPRSQDDARRALEIAVEANVPILPRGAGTSQCGQTVGQALVIDNSKFLNSIGTLDVEARTVWVEPGVVLDELNARLKPHGLWYPVDVSTSAQATLGGMTANNSCGARSIRYGNMVHNVEAVETWLTSGDIVEFGPVPARGTTESKHEGTHGAANGAARGGRNRVTSAPPRFRQIVETIRERCEAEKEEIAGRFPGVLRKVAGYNIDIVSAGAFNSAHLLVGSEGTLGYFRRIKLKLSPLPTHRTLGIVHFPAFYDAMAATQHIVELNPSAVELVDRTMIELARSIDAFSATVAQAIRGEPDAILLVEFAGDDREQQLENLTRLTELMGDIGHADSVVEIVDPQLQRAVWSVRKAGLNIMMSMKDVGKPVSFIEDCAVPLDKLAEYTDRLTRVFARHGTRGTWYAHASVGCLHVRPVLDLRHDADVEKMRTIAEEACALVREYKGSYSGEHGDGLVRSEWIEPMYGPRIVRIFEAIKRVCDPKGLMNPGKIVAPTRMDDRSLFRYKPGYGTDRIATGFDWSRHEAGPRDAGRGFAAAVEMCHNNGHCRKFDAGTMCPSYRVTRNEKDLTRGRANSLRLALSGQLGTAALTSEAMYRTMELCVSCKGCRRECPTGIDMARMKTEFLFQYHQVHPRSLKDKLIARLPQHAPSLARFAPIVNLRDRIPGLAALAEAVTGVSKRRSLPRWRRDYFRPEEYETRQSAGPEVALLADTFNMYFEPENLRAAVSVLQAAGYRVSIATPEAERRPLCCGRTYLAAGMIEEARAEAKRTVRALAPFLARNVPIVGLEPACVLGLRDEFPALVPESEGLATATLTLEEFIVQERAGGRFAPGLAATPFKRALVHGHCHQKAFDLMPSVARALSLIPELDVSVLDTGCCGMAGAFGYDARYIDVSLKMAEESLLPSIRQADDETVIVADGTSCRHQIRDGAGRSAIHVARLMEQALPIGLGSRTTRQVE
jgi:FAD/FMN-containing dehydrogenase/Fe-S oxidoreductase